MNVLKIGSKGSDVKELQAKLHLITDGIFGKGTEEAVKEFQTTNGLVADGIVGPSTWNKLNRTSDRKINEIILHCTATQEGKDYTVEDVRKMHLQRGWSDIGYHFLIYRDGSINEGRDVNKVGAHCQGRNSNSIGISYVGGVQKDGKTPKDTRTPEQKQALIKLVKDLMAKYNLSKTQIRCHNEYANKACPSFKLETFLKELENG